MRESFNYNYIIMDELLQEASSLLNKPLESRDLNDLSRMSIVKFKIWNAIPMAKKVLRLKELDADNLEKNKFLDFKRAKKEKKTTMSEQDMKAQARILKNVIESEIIELEYMYLQLYSFHTELSDAVVSTRMLLKQ